MLCYTTQGAHQQRSAEQSTPTRGRLHAHLEAAALECILQSKQRGRGGRTIPTTGQVILRLAVALVGVNSDTDPHFTNHQNGHNHGRLQWQENPMHIQSD